MIFTYLISNSNIVLAATHAIFTRSCVSFLLDWIFKIFVVLSLKSMVTLIPIVYMDSIYYRKSGSIIPFSPSSLSVSWAAIRARRAPKASESCSMSGERSIKALFSRYLCV